MEHHKYLKYKAKYLNLKEQNRVPNEQNRVFVGQKQIGGHKQHILLFGVSSSGKSSLSKEFVKHGFVHVSEELNSFFSFVHQGICLI